MCTLVHAMIAIHLRYTNGGMQGLIVIGMRTLLLDANSELFLTFFFLL